MDEAAQEFRNAFDIQCMGGDSVSVQDMVEYLGITDKTIYARLKKMNGEVSLKKGRIFHQNQAQIDVFTEEDEGPGSDLKRIRGVFLLPRERRTIFTAGPSSLCHERG